MIQTLLIGLLFAAVPQVTWQKTFDMQANEMAHGSILCPDGEGIIVAGQTHQDIWVYKLATADGDSIWAQTQDNGGNQDVGHDVAITPDGQVIFVGSVTVPDVDPQLLMCGFSESGELLWTYPISKNGACGAPSLRCGVNDTCYLAAWCLRDVNSYDGILYAFSSGGSPSPLWDGPGPRQALTGIDIDNQGDIFLSQSEFEGCRLWKRKADGSIIWLSEYEEDDIELRGWQCRVAPSGDIFLGGYRYSETVDFLLLKWNSDSSHAWTPGKHYDLGYEEYCSDLWVDAISDCYLAGWQEQGDDDVALIKTDSAGNMLWSWIYEMEGDQEIEAIEVDEDGYIYLAGSHHNGADWDMLVMQVRQPLEVSGFLDDGTDNPTLADVPIVIIGDTTLEILTDSEAKYSVELYNGGTYTITPQLPGWVFDPPSVIYDPLVHRELDVYFWGEWTGIRKDDVNLSYPSWELISSCGSSITLKYSGYPDGFHASVFNASGRKVDGIYATSSAGTATWGDNHSPGVYFIRTCSKGISLTRRVLIVQ